MPQVWGAIVLALSLLAWLGQVVSWLRPETAVRLSLREADTDVEPVFGSDASGEAIWDSLVLWILPLAALMLILDEPAWAVLGLVGGGAFLYYAGRGIVTRATMQRRGFRIGSPQAVRLGYVFLVIWGAMALATIIAATAALPDL